MLKLVDGFASDVYAATIEVSLKVLYFKAPHYFFKRMITDVDYVVM